MMKIFRQRLKQKISEDKMISLYLIRPMQIDVIKSNLRDIKWTTL